MRRRLDEDGQQEYALALLEGCDPDDALHRAVSADNDNSTSRQLRARVTFNEAWAGWGNYRTFLVDDRTSVEQEASWGRRERAVEMLDACNVKQRRVLELRFGLTDGRPLTLHQAADALGYKYHSSVQQLENSGLRAIRKAQAEAAVLGADELENLRAHRAHRRDIVRQSRARQKEKEAA